MDTAEPASHCVRAGSLAYACVCEGMFEYVHVLPVCSLASPQDEVQMMH